MTVYHINKGIGPSSSGIEYAQKYRFDLVKDFPEKQIFVYCDYIYNNYNRFTESLGIDMARTLNAYKFMAGQKNHLSSYRLEEFQKTLPADFLAEPDRDNAINFSSKDLLYKVWLIPGTAYIDRVDTIRANRLQEVAHYTDRLTSIDYYSGKSVFCRYFFSEEGKLSMKQFLQNDQILLTFLDNCVLYGKSEFYKEFFHRLNFTEKDLVLIDRNTDIAAELLQNKNQAKFAVIVHAEHYSERMTDDNWVLWNNHYEYVFTNRSEIDYFIVSTEKQKRKLQTQFDQTASVGSKTKIITIPVGFVKELSDRRVFESNKYHLMTASRLAPEKHIDILVRAVARLKADFPALSFHIYGAGKLYKDLQDLITELKAMEFIKLEGHQPLDKAIYDSYGTYLSASSSEGFGLTLLDAVAAGLPIVGLDVDYGNSEFVENGRNGYLISPKSFHNEEEQVEFFSKKIGQMLQTMDYDLASRLSKTKARPYLAEEIRGLWRKFYDVSLAQAKDQSVRREEES